jgi:hypothetical protein
MSGWQPSLGVCHALLVGLLPPARAAATTTAQLVCLVPIVDEVEEQVCRQQSVGMVASRRRARCTRVLAPERLIPSRCAVCCWVRPWSSRKKGTSRPSRRVSVLSFTSSGGISEASALTRADLDARMSRLDSLDMHTGLAALRGGL